MGDSLNTRKNSNFVFITCNGKELLSLSFSPIAPTTLSKCLVSWQAEGSTLNLTGKPGFQTLEPILSWNSPLPCFPALHLFLQSTFICRPLASYPDTCSCVRSCQQLKNQDAKVWLGHLTCAGDTSYHLTSRNMWAGDRREMALLSDLAHQLFLSGCKDQTTLGVPHWCSLQHLLLELETPITSLRCSTLCKTLRPLVKLKRYKGYINIKLTFF